MLTGKQPTTLGIYQNGDSPFRSAFPAIETLPQAFRRNGYIAFGSGKFFHDPDPESWDSYWPSLDRDRHPDPSIKPRPANGLTDIGYIDWGELPNSRNEMGDYRIASEWAPRALDSCYEKPFFMGVGLYKPHLPWFLPADYYRRFPSSAVVLPKVLTNDTDDLPATALRWVHHGSEHESIEAASKWGEGVAAYLSAISFADEMLGLILDQLASSKHAKNTIVVVCSDNGWHLGEKTRWGKNTLWHESTRVPLIVYDPRSNKLGAECHATVSLVDIFPTLANICRLETEPNLDGRSLLPLIENPTIDWEYPVIATRGRNNNAVITDSWRYILYSDGEEELYDLTSDKSEWENVAGRIYTASIQAELRAHIPTNRAKTV